MYLPPQRESLWRKIHVPPATSPAQPLAKVLVAPMGSPGTTRSVDDMLVSFGPYMSM